MATTVTVDAALLRAWSAGAAAALRGASAELDLLNVFPVPDGDTGTNLALTLAEAADAVGALGPDVGVREAARVMLRGALVGARGSSGVIVSEYLRGLVGSLRVPADAAAAHVGAGAVARALDDASGAAYRAVGAPVEGTVLTVARAGARRAPPPGARGPRAAAAPVDVLAAGLEAGRGALALTPTQLPALERAGVLDAGGAGLLVVLGALLACLDPARAGGPGVGVDLGTAPATGPRAAGGSGCDAAAGHTLVAEPGATPDALRERHGGEFEVMYVVEATDQADRTAGAAEPAATRAAAADVPGDALREALGRTGDSVAVVGGDGLWQAHVHTDDPVAAVAAAAVAGTASEVRVRHLASQSGVHGAHRPVVGVVAVTAAPGLVADLARAGAVVVLVLPGSSAGGAVRRAVADTGALDVVVLAGAAGGAVHGVDDRPDAPRTVVLDALLEVQVVVGAATLAASAGADGAGAPGPAGEAVADLVRAVRGVRTAVVPPGAVGGGGHAGAVLAATDDLLRAGGGLVTVLTGAATAPGVADEVVRGLAAAHPEVDVVVLPAGTAGADVTVGVE
ncbi:DAK2 domain-containing protein [Actinotalea solisilvae]|uniref:DAK2 domain-containing protein n=1 Tax=Actinotalea solisilvae TaxID=2072922 RepID=UPI0018F240E4|nr:DAK2 domain-containing protein [Actinotalea solisilvae]